MSAVVIFVIVLFILFVIAFASKRRFGMLGLALAAGSVLSSLCADDLTTIVREFGAALLSPPLGAVVSAVLVLLPATALLMTGAKYKKVTHRIAGSLLFSVLGTALLLEPLGQALILQGPGRELFDVATLYQKYIVSIGIFLAVIELLITRSPNKHKDAKH